MQLVLPHIVLYILYTLQKAGFEAYIVGGAVRDILLQAQGKTTHSAKDFDFTTNAKPEEIQALFPESFYENTFGTVSVTAEHIAENLGIPLSSLVPEKPVITSSTALIDPEKISKLHQSLSLPQSEKQTEPLLLPFEITTFRSESQYADFRRPSELSWGTSIAEDLQRRDFTINAIALSVKKTHLETLFSSVDVWSTYETTLTKDLYTIHDLFDSLKDLEEGVIRTVGDPHERFLEDALRMLRAIRFSVQLNMRIDDATYAAIETHANNVQHISWERIGSELMKMMKSHFPKEAVEMLDGAQLLELILPEVQEGKGVMQGGHHTTDVWTHSLDALATCPSTDPVVRLATLLHDVGKPRTHKLINNSPTFYNHEIVGARMAKDIAQRLRLSKKDIEKIYILVRYHMFYYQPENTDASIRRFMRKVGLDNINDILDLREADRLGSGARKTSWRLEEMKERMTEQLHQPFSVTDLDIDGVVIIQTLELKPGPVVGEILNYLFETVLEDPSLNTQSQLLELAQQYLAQKQERVSESGSE